jgi:prophage regulatory protein
MHPKGENERFLTIFQVLERIPFSKPHIYRLMRRHQFPRQIRVGARRVGWLESDIDRFIEEKISEARDEPLPPSSSDSLPLEDA